MIVICFKNRHCVNLNRDTHFSTKGTKCCHEANVAQINASATISIMT